MKKKIKPWTVALIALGALLLIAAIGAIIDYTTQDPLQKKLNQLEKYVTQDMDRRDIEKNTSQYIVFISTSNGEYRANVSMGKGDTFHEAFNAAKDNVLALAKTSSLTTKYVKFDMAYDVIGMEMSEATEYLATSTQG